MSTKLIVLRGPSGSGKSSIAKAVRLEWVERVGPMALIEQDHFRRMVLKEKDVPHGLNIELIKQTVLFVLEHGYSVIMEGIFFSGRYEGMFKELIAAHPSENYFFYFDIPFEETLRRHETKPNKNDFGEKEMREWYKPSDFLGCVKEKVIPEASSFDDSCELILTASGLTGSPA